MSPVRQEVKNRGTKRDSPLQGESRMILSAEMRGGLGPEKWREGELVYAGSTLCVDI